MFSFSLVDFDYQVFRILNGLAGRSAVLDFIFVALAEGVIFLMIAGLAVFILTEKHHRPRRLLGMMPEHQPRRLLAMISYHQARRSLVLFQAFCAVFFGRAIIVPLIRMYFLRPRPFIAAHVTELLTKNPNEASFPSGHATIMFALAFSIFFTNVRWGIFYLVLATVSSLARVVVGVHFPFDIAGGMVAGALSALVTKIIFDFWLNKKKNKE